MPQSPRGLVCVSTWNRVRSQHWGEGQLSVAQGPQAQGIWSPMHKAFQLWVTY